MTSIPIDQQFRIVDNVERLRAINPQAVADAFAVLPVPDRLADEAEERAMMSARAISYGVGFIDDCLRAMLPHDLVLLGAYAGVGKTQLAWSIAAENAANGRNVTMFALEAEPREIERRALHRKVCQLAARVGARAPAYVDWYMGRAADPRIASISEQAHALVARELETMATYYRDRKFTVADIRRLFAAEHGKSELIVLDHLHYVDSDDQSETRAQKHAIQAVRETALEVGIPVVCVAHLRKRQLVGKHTPIVPDLDDFHGSSDLPKIATHAIMLARAERTEHDPQDVVPTLMHIPKDRRSGASGLIARVDYSLTHQRYSNSYQLGRAVGNEWQPITDPPAWAKGAL